MVLAFLSKEGESGLWRGKENHLLCLAKQSQTKQMYYLKKNPCCLSAFAGYTTFNVEIAFTEDRCSWVFYWRTSVDWNKKMKIHIVYMNNVICSHCLETDGVKALCCLYFPAIHATEKKRTAPSISRKTHDCMCPCVSHNHIRDDLYLVVMYELSSFFGGKK